MTYASDMPTVERVARTDAGLASELRLAVMRLRRRLASERHPDNELSLGEMSVLGVLYRRGNLSVGELAAFEGVKPPSMTRTVNSLADRGLVRKRPDEDDGRLVVVCLSDRAEALVLADRQRRDAWLARRLREFDPAERDLLRRALPLLTTLADAD